MTSDGRLQLGDIVPGTCTPVAAIPVQLLKVDSEGKLAVLDSSDVNPLRNFPMVNLSDPSAPNSVVNIRAAFAAKGLTICNDAFAHPNTPLELWVKVSGGCLYVWGESPESLGHALGWEAYRFNLDGTQDMAFGTVYISIADMGAGAGADARAGMACGQVDGKLVASGVVINEDGNYQKFLTRIKSNGTFDSNFGTGGIEQVTPVTSGDDSNAYWDDVSTGIKIRPDDSNKIGFALPSMTPPSDPGGRVKTGFYNLQPDGSFIDYLIGADDPDLIDGYYTRAAAILANGKFVSALSDNDTGYIPYIAIYNSDGSFASKITLPAMYVYDSLALVGQTDGKFLFASVLSSNLTLTRYKTDNSVDWTITVTPVISPSPVSPPGLEIAVDSGGKIMLAVINTATGKLFIYKFNSDGTADTSYGTSGVVTVTIDLTNIRIGTYGSTGLALALS